MRFYIFIILLLASLGVDIYLSDTMLPKVNYVTLKTVLHPLNQMSNHFDRVQKMKPINQDTVYTITYPDTKFNILN